MKKAVISILLMVFSISILGIRIYKGVILDQQVTGHLKRAADANTIDLANEELTYAINYLNKHQITTGYTSILWKTPDEDVGFWYKNIVASKRELDNLKKDSPPLEKTNILMKLRETLVDTGEKTSVTVPKGLSVFPNNKIWSLWMLLAIISGTIGFGVFINALEKKSTNK